MLKFSECSPDRRIMFHLTALVYDENTEVVRCRYVVLFLLLACVAVLVTRIEKFEKYFPNDLALYHSSISPNVFQNSRKYIDKDVPYKKHIHNPQLFHEKDSLANNVAVSNKASKEICAEVQASMHLARDMKQQGKYDKALKIYQRAFALDRLHPDLLNEYGEFLEETQKDIVKAEHMYCRALIVSPYHTKALTNRQRTLPLVEQIDQIAFNRVDKKRDIVVKVPDSHAGLRRMKKESYFRHIHHTTAIEGNTFTLSETRSFVETRIVIAGKSIMEHNEILGMDSAYHFVNSSLVYRIGEITIQDILNIHRHVLGYVDPIGAGQFRTTQVFVGNHIPPNANEVESLMRDYTEWLNSDEALSLHPIELAALAHYRLVFIHPFYDGNGRTSRLLMNLILMQAGYPPIIIFKEEKHLYYQRLEEANEGDVRPFIRFIAACTERTLDEYIWATLESPTGNVPSLSKQSDSQRVIVIDPEDATIDRLTTEGYREYMKPYL